MLEEGRRAPDFTTVNQNGKKVKLNSFRGKKNVVLYLFRYIRSITFPIRGERQIYRLIHTCFVELLLDPWIPHT